MFRAAPVSGGSCERVRQCARKSELGGAVTGHHEEDAKAAHRDFRFPIPATGYTSLKTALCRACVLHLAPYSPTATRSLETEMLAAFGRLEQLPLPVQAARIA